MNPLYFTLAVEDELGEVVAREIIGQCGRPFRVNQCLRRSGSGYLRTKIRSLNKAAAGLRLFVLTDLDDPGSCAPDLIRSWLGSHRRRPNLVFRVAVVEVESWILAHRESVAIFLKVPLNRVPSDTDAIPEPKEFLVDLARRSPSKRIRDDLVPEKGSTSKVGPLYNSSLARFVATDWKANLARRHSKSLDRALAQLESF